MNTMISWRHQYDQVRDTIEREKTDINITEPSLTQQHFAEDADLNVIVRRFGITDGATMPTAAIDPRYYGDFTDAPSFREALDTTREASERFQQLPAEIRKRFRNDPVELWEFVQDPKNDAEAATLGLIQKPPTPPPAAP